jgi:miniconductance mechanosensitive channel
MIFKDILNWLNENPTIRQILIIVGILLLSYISYLVTRKIILKGLGMLVKRSKTRLDDIIFEKVIARRLAYIVPILVVYNFAYLAPSLTGAIQRAAFALIFLILLTAVASFLHAVNDIYEQKNQLEGRPIKGYIQAIVIALYIVGGLVMVGILTGQSLWVLLSGVGALMAVILLIFRDTILSIVASFQITTNDLVRLNDWIEVPTYGADGDVVEIALHTIKVQNWDKTITVIPTHKLIEVSFKNWRGMQETGGRRIKRSIFIDIDSIKFCDEHMLEKLEKIELLKDYLQEKKSEVEKNNREKNIDTSCIVNGRRLTNIGTFRAYIVAYLRNHNKIKQELTFLIRQLASGPTGIPIEIYVFTNDIRWSNYEAIQADIFDHLLAVVREFDLRVFQYPGSKDFENLKIEATTKGRAAAAL